MSYSHPISLFSILLLLLTFSCLVHAQQPYIGQAITRCDITDNSTSAFGYSCNGLNRTCQSYLTFRSRPPFDSVSSISDLLSADRTQLAQLNAVVQNARFQTNQMVLVPVDCSCSGDYYQSNTSYIVPPGSSYLITANNTFQGLSTCQAIQAQNGNIPPTSLNAGITLSVPLRCACPTTNQSNAGVNYLLSYLVSSGQIVPVISEIFGVDMQRILQANELTEQDIIYPFTTLLIPLQNPPSASQTREPPPPPPTPPPPPPPPTSESSNRTWVYILVGVLGGLALVSVIGASIFCLFFRKRKKKNEPIIGSKSYKAYEKPMDKKFSSEEESQYLEGVSSIAQSLKVYTFKELQSATEYFSPNCWIKGSVYRGKINGDFAAIKKMNGDVSKEINLLNKINHFNLIRLSGVCFKEGDYYLVYEYAINGPLSEWVYYGNTSQKFLNWTQRIQIALDVATGIDYLHSFTSPPYVHKDLKASNVLLDSDLRAKIANFNLARSAEGQDGQFALTKHIIGTKGYMAPEYLENGLVSPKLDVYSFGVLMVEILTGKEVSVLCEGKNTQLPDVLGSVIGEESGEENLSDFIDPSLQGNYPTELAMFVVRLIHSCIRKDPSHRPDMSEIVQAISRTMAVVN